MARPRSYKHPTRDPITGQTMPMYNLWNDIQRRCNNVKRKQYKDYGGRGITIDVRWHDFDQFVDDVEAAIGPRPGARWTLDRINTNGNYEPGNVQWATRATQNQHTRKTKLTWTLVNQIRSQHATGLYFLRELADVYNVGISQISKVVRGTSWRM